jgi:hypothetical protein
MEKAKREDIPAGMRLYGNYGWDTFKTDWNMG